MNKYLVLGAAVMVGLAAACGGDDTGSGNASSSEAGAGGSSASAAAGKGGPGATVAAGKGGSAAGTGDEPAADGGKGGAGGKAAAGAAGQAAGGAGGAPAAGEKDIIETATAAGNFTQLAAALQKAGLVDALKGKGPFTVFAPTDAAFDALEKAKPGTVAGLTTEQLGGVLKYHVISGSAAKAADLKNGELLKTLAGPSLAIDLSSDKPKVNGVIVSMTDIIASNGVIHVIDGVLLPPGDIVEVATAAGSFSKLAQALTSAGLVDTLKGDGPFTVFAPTDDAFAKLASAPTGDALKNVLLYHVLSGTLGPLDLKEGGAALTASGAPVLFSLKDGAKIDAAKITITNVVAKNGVIHVIDAVLVPPADDLVAAATKAGTFTQLANALTNAGLVSTLQGKGPYTVFAPTDAAFMKLSSVPSGDALKNVLLYHVVDGAIGSGDLKAGMVPTLLQGKDLTVDLTSGVKINGANVSMANVLTKNGIIHVIDAVLVPN